MACKIARSQRLRLLTPGIAQEQGVRKETKDNGGNETEHPETLAGMCWRQGTPPHRHYIQEGNIVIKKLSDKDNFSNKFT